MDAKATADAPAIVPEGGGSDGRFDVAVVGGGPAGYVIAALLARSKHTVVLVDPAPARPWPNNYGAWRKEWEALAAKLGLPGLRDCAARRWDITDCFFGGSFDTPFDERTRLDQAYLQVDRVALKELLQAQHAEFGVRLLEGRVGAELRAPNVFDSGLAHDGRGSTLTVEPVGGGPALGEVSARVVVDATGFESKLTSRETAEESGLWRDIDPGYQIAYGMCVDVPSGDIAPYATEAMTLFDYRTDHLVGTDMLADAEERPSFVYVMPLSERPGEKVFFEETSLVGRGDRRLEFATLKRRLLRRLEFLGISYDPASVREEEFCYIPMGGALPDASQRVVPFGGAANTVHPSTGYQLCRMLASSTDVAAALSAELGRGDAFDPDACAAAAHAALWPRANRLQRDFAVFGGEFLGAQEVEILRGFFGAFFALDPGVWGGFLAGWPGLPGNEYHDTYLARLRYGISIFVKFPSKVLAAFLGYLATFSLENGPLIMRSIFTPVFDVLEGQPSAPRSRHDRARTVYVRGDTAAKMEAAEMLRESRRGEPSPQVAMLEEEMARG